MDPKGTPEAAEHEALLWQRLRTSGGADIRGQLIRMHARLARGAAHDVHAKVRSLGIEFGDLSQSAAKGLIEAVDRFDPAEGVNFAAFARKRIRGSILNDLHKESELAAQLAFRKEMVRERAKSVEEKTDDVFADLVQTALGLAVGFMLEGSAMFASQKAERSEEEAYSKANELRYLRQELRRLVDLLPESEKFVIRLHYLEGESFTEIAKKMKLTKSRISQLHTGGLKALLKKRRNNASIDILLD